MGCLSKFRNPWRMSITFLLTVMSLTLLGPTVESVDARHFGFRGGFRGSFGRSFGRSFNRGRSFNNRRFGSFRRFGFRGFRGFGRSRFNSLAFRSRRFGFGGFNNFRRVNNFGFRGGRTRFRSFQPGFRTFAFNHFPVRRIHSGVGTFHHPNTFVANCFSAGPNHFTSVRLPARIVAGTGWTQLANGQPVAARTSFANDIAAGGSPGIARVGFALAEADAGDLDRGVWAMRRAFTADKDMAASLMMDDSMSELVARVTRLYEQRMEEKGNNSEDAFMLAAMYQLQGDPEMAMMAMDYALKANDTQVSTTNLSQLIESEMSTIPMTNSAGWELLAAGDHGNAVTNFIQEIGKDETAGAPKLGYALAIAASGNLEQGTWALRRAFEIDPEGASDVMLSGKLRSVVEGVTEKYVSNAEEQGVDKDNSYTLATLFMLQGDIEAAEMVVKNSEIAPDSYVATMIVSEMKTQMTMMGEAKENMEDVQATGYDEFVASQDGSGTKDVASQGSDSKEEAIILGSASKNPIEDGSGAKESLSGSSSKEMVPAEVIPAEIVPLDSSSSNPVESGSDLELTPAGSGIKLPEASGSGTKIPTNEGSGTRF